MVRKNTVSRSLAVGMIGLAMTPATALPGGFSLPPHFDSAAPYTVLVDVSTPGLQSFEISGFATDEDQGDIVTIGLGGPRPWSYFSSVDGNPATFIFGGRNLRYNHIGTYIFGLGAYDNSFPIFSDTQTTITVRIIPEPVAVTLVFLGPAMFQRRRQR